MCRREPREAEDGRSRLRRSKGRGADFSKASLAVGVFLEGGGVRGSSGCGRLGSGGGGRGEETHLVHHPEEGAEGRVMPAEVKEVSVCVGMDLFALPPPQTLPQLFFGIPCREVLACLLLTFFNFCILPLS